MIVLERGVQNFFENETVVTINNTACRDVTVDPISLASLTCIAPMGAGRVSLLVQVGSEYGGFTFVYDRPSVLSISPSPMDAEVGGVLQVRHATCTWVLS